MKKLGLYPVLLIFSCISGFAQMVPPPEWVNYEQVFGVTNNLRQYDYDVYATRSSVPAGILWPGEQPGYTIQIVNKTGGPLKTSGRVDLIRYGTRGRANDVWLPEMVKFAEAGSIPVSVDIAAGGQASLEINPVIPSAFGGYALVLDLGSHGRRLITSLVRTFSANPQRLQYPKQALDDMGADFLQRVGVQAIRMGVDYTPTTAPDYRAKMEALDHKLKEYKERNITVLFMFGAGTAPMPLGMSRSFLDSNNVMRKTKQDYAWLPSSDGDFSEYVKRLCVKYGWPAGPVTAVSLWNEPWEGMSISGWQADIPRYREIYKAMADAVLKARQTGVEVLVGGGDSNSNAWDKLFADGKMTFLPIFDFCSIHYQGMESPAIYPEWVNRRSPYGRVRVWDTESWVGNTDDRIGLVVATNRSAGYDRSMGIYAGYMFTGGGSINGNGAGGRSAISATWSPAAAVGAVQHLVGERDFKELLFKDGLPWVMLFNGYNNDPDDGTAVVCGDIAQAFGAEHVLYRSVKLSGGSMTLPDNPPFKLYDFYGNPVPPVDGKIIIPLNSQGYYLRTDGTKGSFAKLMASLREARIEGYQPVEIIAKDMTAPVSPNAVMQLQLRNILNRPLQGRLQVSLGNLTVAAPATVSLRPHEVLTVPVKITGGQAAPDNRYRLAVQFDAGRDGAAAHEEDMHVNMISRLNINVDGRLDDWQGALPQTVSSKGSGGVSLTEAAWYPFKNFDTRAGGYANGYFAYDDRYFYFAGKVADSTPFPGTYRFAERPDDEFFYPDTAYVMDMQRTHVSKESSTPAGSYWESGDNTNSFGIDLRLPEDHPAQVAFYLPNIKVSGLSMDVLDPAGKVLLTRRIDKLWNGAYEVLNLSGKVRVVFHSFGWWYTPKLGAIFFDEARGTEAFVKEDLDTKGNWKGAYGNQGYYIVGAESRLPAGVTIQPVHQEFPTPLVWPAGVRHFTYRKNPVTPDNSGLGYLYDNVLLAFNVLPEGQDGMLAYPPGTMPHYTGYKCTDYEYALNPVAPQYGGGAEIWRLLAPGLNRKHFFPRQPKSEREGAVKDGQLVIRREGNTVITECAIPWSELPDVKKAMDEGRTVKLSFRVNDNGTPGSCMELAKDRSVSKVNARAFHPDWKTHWANELEFSFEKRPPAAVAAGKGVFNITDHGAQGDGLTDNTVILQQQIDSCSRQGGGTVLVPAGKFLTGTLYMKDNVDLHLDEGAVLLGSTRPQDYPSNTPEATAGERAGIAAGDRAALVFAENVRHISITGTGAIDGQGGNAAFQKGDNAPGRPRLIYFSGCRDIRIQDITLKNSAFWVQYYSACDGLVIRDIKVYSHCNWNNDGLDIDSRNVTVSGCTIDSDDDALCLKSENPASACENVRVTHCLLASNCNAIKLGTASRTGFKHINIADCTVHAAAEDNIRHWKKNLSFISADRTVLAGIAIETVDGGATEDIHVANIRMDDVQTPIFIRLGDRQRRAVPGAAPAVSSLKDVTISRITATARSLITSSITGIPGAAVENVSLDDITITGPGGGITGQAHMPVPEKENAYPENRMFGNSLPASGLYARHVKGLSLSRLKLKTGLPDQRPSIVREDVGTVRDPVQAQNPDLTFAKFATGDSLAWKEPAFDDKNWNSIRTGLPWEQQGYKGYDGYAWYRFHFRLPSSLIAESRLKDSIRICLSKIDDADEIYLNGVRIGKTGSFPADPKGFVTKNYVVREYHFPTHAGGSKIPRSSPQHSLLHWDSDNVLAVRVYDGGGNGGIYPSIPFVSMIDAIDGINITANSAYDSSYKVEVTNNTGVPINGKLVVSVKEIAGGRNISAVFTDEGTGKTKTLSVLSGRILTPPPPSRPRINGAKVFGVRPGSPFLFKMAATGRKPLHYSVKNLPAGLSVDSSTGLITGVLTREGEYQMQFVVSNTEGKDERGFTVKAGQLLSLTPPMGWNSWNCWGLSVNDTNVRSSAQALIDKGLADHGWNYINIDDAWQAPARAGDGSITANEKFPDMKALGEWLHGNGLKFGIYSSPGVKTCGRFLGSYGHEKQDADSYARWGVDYLKYDWCSYGKIAGSDTALDTYIKPYRVMDQALREQPRDILYSLCQYGMKDVWKWGREVDGNCWRTTGDITDNWESVKATGFTQDSLYSYAGPGHWNDPDMLIVGQIGWGDPHPTRLTPEEQYAHISLWCLLSAPLLIGGDISRMDDFTLGLLTNDEVIALDQDPLGRQARRLINTGSFQVWMKELEDGSRAIGIFNMADSSQVIHVSWDDLQVEKDQRARDLWRQKDLGDYATGFQTELAPHGVRLIKISPQLNTLVPVMQNRDPLYNWSSRHAEILALNKTAPPKNVILGNSIVHYWGGSPSGPFTNGSDSWNEWLEPLGVRNMGFGWDKIENVWWRVLHGELDGYSARHVLVMIGTNNLNGNTDGEIITGLANLVLAVRQRQPEANILLAGLLPRRNMESRIAFLNKDIEKLAVSKNLTYVDPGKHLISGDGKIDESLFRDGLHPNAAGYRKLAPEISSWLKN